MYSGTAGLSKALAVRSLVFLCVSIYDYMCAIYCNCYTEYFPPCSRPAVCKVPGVSAGCTTWAVDSLRRYAQLFL